MTLKQLLKPDWRKIVIFILIIILSNLPIISYTAEGRICEPCSAEKPNCCPDSMILSVIFYPFLKYPVNHSLDIDVYTYGIPLLEIARLLTWYISMEYTFSVIVVILLLLVNIFYWYLLSCIIVGIFDRLKKK
jgi:Cu/Ag efflux pump CusA